MRKATMFVLAAALSVSLVGCGSATKETEKATEKAAVTEAVTEAAATEAETETEAAATEAVTETETLAAEAETETEVVTEEETEAAETEAVTEEVTEAVTEAVTEEVTEVVTEAVTEEVTEAAAETEAVTEAAETEAVTEAAETEEVTEAAETEEVTEAAETEAVTEAAETEAVTEAAETEEVTEAAETEAVTEAAETEEVTEAAETEVVTEAAETEEFVVPEGTTYKAALLLNGTLGDKSFFDSANAGLEALQEELGEDVFTFKVEQMGATSADEAKWEPTLYDYCDDGSYDVIIVGTWQMLDALTNAANDYPDQKFIYFDEAFDFSAGGEENVYDVMYKQNEVSYLVGAAAAMMTTDADLEKVNPDDKIIGFLGGMENSVIKDFLAGYIQGAKDVDPEIQVALAYVGNFYDSASGKDLALAQYNNGVDVGYNVAGSAGLGQIEAAGDVDRYAFGVDSDQAALLPDYAEYIPTSAIKNVGNSLIRAIKLDMYDELPYGTLEYLGFAEGGVELVLDEHYEEILPEDIRTAVADLQDKIVAGEITVPTTLGENAMSTEEFDALVDSVKVQ